MIAAGALAFALAVAAGSGSMAGAGAAHESEVQAWRQAREARLRADEGWLTVAGLFWLKEGENRIGTAEGTEIRLPAHAPAGAGVIRVTRGEVTFTVSPELKATLDGAPAASGALRSDKGGTPNVLAIGRVRLFLVERAGKLAIRMRDLDAPARKRFAGLRFFPVQERYRVEARFLPHATPKTIAVPTILGTPERMPSPGTAVFTLGGKELRLDAVLEAANAKQLFFIFRDATSGKETYGAGRFLHAPLPAEGKTVLDFNKAYTPPCGFTAFATCPLPPPQNRLPVRVEAGELAPAGH